MDGSVEKRSSSRLSTLDKGLVVAGVVGGVFVLLWVTRVVLGLALFAFKVAILVVVVGLVIRLVHLFTRGRR